MVLHLQERSCTRPTEPQRSMHMGSPPRGPLTGQGPLFTTQQALLDGAAPQNPPGDGSESLPWSKLQLVKSVGQQRDNPWESLRMQKIRPHPRPAYSESALLTRSPGNSSAHFHQACPLFPCKKLFWITHLSLPLPPSFPSPISFLARRYLI